MQAIKDTKSWLRRFHKYGLEHDALLGDTVRLSNNLESLWSSHYGKQAGFDSIKALQVNPEIVVAGKKVEKGNPHIILSTFKGLVAMGMSHRMAGLYRNIAEQAPSPHTLKEWLGNPQLEGEGPIEPPRLMRVHDVRELKDGNIGIYGKSFDGSDLSHAFRDAPYYELPAKGNSLSAGDIVGLTGRWTSQIKGVDGPRVRKVEASQCINFTKDRLASSMLALAGHTKQLEDIADATFPFKDHKSVSYEQWWERVAHSLPRKSVNNLLHTLDHAVNNLTTYVNHEHSAFPHPISNAAQDLHHNVKNYFTRYYKQGQYPESEALALMTSATALNHPNDHEERIAGVKRTRNGDFSTPLILTESLAQQRDFATLLSQRIPHMEDVPDAVIKAFTFNEEKPSFMQKFRTSCHYLEGAMPHTSKYKNPQLCWLDVKKFLDPKVAKEITEVIQSWAGQAHNLTPELVGQALQIPAEDIKSELAEFQKSLDRQASHAVSLTGTQRILNETERGVSEFVRLANVTYSLKRGCLKIMDVSSVVVDAIKGIFKPPSR